MRSILVFSVILGSASLAACKSSPHDAAKATTDTQTALPASDPATTAAAPAVDEVSIPVLASALKSKSATVIDANGSETRAEYGVIPGAVLLSDHRSYALSELPQEKSANLVFYCGGTACRASDAAAARALTAGYSNVHVLRDGIRGWKNAGQLTEQPRS